MSQPDLVQGLLKDLGTQIEDLKRFYSQNPRLEVVVYDTWTVKDVLGHLVMWHRSFADNLEAQAQGRKPPLLRGSLADLNERGVSEARPRPLVDLLDDLDRAQAMVAAHIGDPALGQIRYRAGSRPYSREEHLQVVTRHIAGHLKDLRKAMTR